MEEKNFVCEECKKQFQTKEALESHIKDRHEAVEEKEAQKHAVEEKKEQEKLLEKKAEERTKRAKTLGTYRNYAIIALIALISIYGIFSLAKSLQTTKKINQELGIPNHPIHWHPNLRIIINGEEQIIPPNIGITPSIHFPVHTHDSDGVIHLENNNPTLENMQLGYFFNVWGKTFSKDCIFSYCSNENKTIKMFVNGKENLEFEKYIMREDDKIEIRYEQF